MCEETKYIYLKSHPLFATLSEQKVKDACSSVKAKTLCRGEVFGFGDASYSKIYLLIKGKIKIAESAHMHGDLIKDILTAYDIFGDLSLEGKPCIDEYAEALTANTVVCFFNVVDIKTILRDNPLMTLSYANLVNNKLKKLQDRHSDLIFHDAKFRLIRFIKNWARTDGSRVGNKIVLLNYLTHSDIAGVIATSRQSVNVLFNELRDSGLIQYDRKRIELNDSRVWN